MAWIQRGPNLIVENALGFFARIPSVLSTAWNLFDSATQRQLLAMPRDLPPQFWPTSGAVRSVYTASGRSSISANVVRFANLNVFGGMGSAGGPQAANGVWSDDASGTFLNINSQPCTLLIMASGQIQVSASNASQLVIGNNVGGVYTESSARLSVAAGGAAVQVPHTINFLYNATPGEFIGLHSVGESANVVATNLNDWRLHILLF